MPTPQKWFTVDCDCSSEPFQGRRTAYTIEGMISQAMDGLRDGQASGVLRDPRAADIGQWLMHTAGEEIIERQWAPKRFAVYINCDGPRFNKLDEEMLLETLRADLRKIAGNIRTGRWAGALMENGHTYGQWRVDWA